MKRIGNLESNKTYNPRNVKPDIPIDVDEVDSAMERYVRQKYEQRIYMHDSRPGTRHNTGSTSSEDRPPPLPPKPTGRFGFGLRKAATSPRNLTPPMSPNDFGLETSPPRVNKPSRVFGSNVNPSSDGLESKLATLRDMGFPDEKRNSTVLKGLNGNLDKAVEALIRLGEQNPHGKSRGNTPTPPAKPNANGISFDNAKSTTAAAVSTNPFDALDNMAPSQQQMPYGVSSGQPPAQQNSYNPFLSQGQAQAPQIQQQQQQQQQQPIFLQQQQQQIPQQDPNFQQNPFMQQQQNPFNQQQQSLEQSFQGMQLSNQQPQQALFPNRTGGYGHTPSSQYTHTNPFHQTSFTPPPMPQISEQGSSFFTPQPQYQSMSSPTSPGNPFLKMSRSQIFPPTNSNAFGQQPIQQQPIQQQPIQQQPIQQQPIQQQPIQQQTVQQQQGQMPQQFSQQPQVPNPWMQQQQQNYSPSSQMSNPWRAQQQNYQQPAFQQSTGSQPQNFQQTTFQGNPSPFDKSTILSLYNNSQLAPQPLQQSQQTFAAPTSTATPPVQASNHMNPFTPSPAASQQGPALSAAQVPGVRHVSHESVDFAGLMGGRHSPDAFSGLSANYKR